MIKYEDECVGCPPELGCYGDACPNRHIPYYYCDRCGEEVDAYFDINNEMICDNCIHDIVKEMFDYYIL